MLAATEDRNQPNVSRRVARFAQLVRYAMKNGINIVNGNRVSLHEIEMGLKEAWNDRQA